VSQLPRRSLLLVTGAALLALVALAGCSGSSTPAATKQPNQGANGDASGSAGTVAVRDMVLVNGPEGSKSATLVGAIVGSTSDDLLTGLTVVPAPQSSYITNDSISVPAHTTVPIGHSGEQHINLYGWDPGSSSAIVPVTFVFRDAGETTLQVKVVPARDEYAGIVPVPSTAPSS
jgi:hypothetical protein